MNYNKPIKQELFKMNEKNFEFYNKLGVNPFMEFAIVGGFNTFVDLDLIYPFINKSKTILELGAGYGRCIEFFLKKGFNGKIIAVEQSAALIDHLKEKYLQFENISLLQEDIKNLQLSEKMDAALWMWSGLIDFSKEQQFLCLKKIFGILNDGGKIIVDTPKIGFTTITQHKIGFTAVAENDEKNLSFNTPFGELNCYIPDEKEMEEARKEIGFKAMKVINYKTATEKQRTIYIIEK
jgi:ubiquinone/menaquinone biosynthesis C-methylase UbiE